MATQGAQSFHALPMPPFGPHVVAPFPNGGIADSGDEIADSEDELGGEPNLLPPVPVLITIPSSR